jgi:hypothetical protein
VQVQYKKLMEVDVAAYNREAAGLNLPKLE